LFCLFVVVDVFVSAGVGCCLENHFFDLGDRERERDRDLDLEDEDELDRDGEGLRDLLRSRLLSRPRSSLALLLWPWLWPWLWLWLLLLLLSPGSLGLRMVLVGAGRALLPGGGSYGAYGSKSRGGVRRLGLPRGLDSRRGGGPRGRLAMYSTVSSRSWINLPLRAFIASVACSTLSN